MGRIDLIFASLMLTSLVLTSLVIASGTGKAVAMSTQEDTRPPGTEHGAQPNYRTGAGDRPGGAMLATRSPVFARNGMAAASSPLAVQAALQVLKAGGSAVDAAIAAHAVLGVVEPMMSSIGGDLFAIVWDPKTKKLHGLNASGRSALGLSLEQMKAVARGGTVPLLGVYSVTTPGTVDGWFELHGRFGRTSMTQLLAPAIGYARDGFAISPVIAGIWQIAVSQTSGERFKAHFTGDLAPFQAVFTPGGKAPQAGQIVRNEDLAATYDMIASKGRDAFYGGEIAQRIDGAMRAMGGPLRLGDFKAYRSNWVEPVSTTYRGFDVHELPMNTQGIAALQILNILEGYDLSSLDRFGPDFVHLFVEAKKLAYEDRARYYAEDSTAPITTLLSKDYAAERRKLIDLKQARPVPDLRDLLIERGDTTYLTIADADGMVVSFISSLSGSFGSFITAPGTGFALQNRGASFALLDGHPNLYAPGKRPFHTIIPAFVTKDGAPFLSFGVMGGAMQPQGHAQIIINMIDFGMNVQDAGDAARIRHSGNLGERLYPRDPKSVVALESGYGPSTAEALRARGHEVTLGPGAGFFGGYQAIQIDAQRRVYIGASEMRFDGHASGY